MTSTPTTRRTRSRSSRQAGYVNVPRKLTDKETYQFDGQIGSLDHVFASASAFPKVTGADIWNINAYESVAREYSRHNYNVTDFYRPDPFRASDHDPEIVGFERRSGQQRGHRPRSSRRKYGHPAVVTLTAEDRARPAFVYVTEGSKVVGLGAVVDGKGPAVLGSRD